MSGFYFKCSSEKYVFRSMIIVNMFIAVILENYTAANDDVSEGITDEDYEMFYEVWVEFDPESTMYIPYENVSELIDVLEPPLQIARPNKFKIVHMDIPVVRFTNPKTGENNFKLFTVQILIVR